MRQVFGGGVGLTVEGFHVGTQALGGAFGHLELANDLNHVAFASSQVFDPALRAGARRLPRPLSQFPNGIKLASHQSVFLFNVRDGLRFGGEGLGFAA